MNPTLPGDDLYRTLIELSPDVIVIHADNQIVFINGVGAETLQLSAEALSGRSIMEFLHPDYRDLVASRVRSMLETGRPAPRIELRFVLPTGDEMVGETTATPFLYDGRPAILVSIRDVTARLQAEEERERLRAERAAERKRREDTQRFLIEIASAMNSSLDYNVTLATLAQLSVPFLADACVVDILEADGSIVPVAIASIDPEQIEYSHDVRRRYPLDPESRTGTPEVLRRGEPLLMPIVPAEIPAINARDEEHRRLLEGLGIRSIMHVPLRSRGRSLGAITFAMTTSGRTYSAADLALAEEVATTAGIAVDNARLYRDAQEALRLRDEFLSVASHELKTPVTALQLQLQSIERAVASVHSDDPAITRVARSTDVARRQTRRLTQLINDLLDVSQIAEGRLQIRPEEVDLLALARDVVERIDEQLRAAGCEVSIEGRGVTGQWDRLRVEQALANLLSNAMKYAAGKPITITVGCDETAASIAVRDTGIGIDADDLQRIFDRYERAVSSHHYGGMGLGLHIAREMVEAHGGNLRVESEPGHGSTFIIELPLARSEAA